MLDEKAALSRHSRPTSFLVYLCTLANIPSSNDLLSSRILTK